MRRIFINGVVGVSLVALGAVGGSLATAGATQPLPPSRATTPELAAILAVSGSCTLILDQAVDLMRANNEVVERFIRSARVEHEELVDLAVLENQPD